MGEHTDSPDEGLMALADFKRAVRQCVQVDAVVHLLGTKRFTVRMSKSWALEIGDFAVSHGEVGIPAYVDKKNHVIIGGSAESGSAKATKEPGDHD